MSWQARYINDPRLGGMFRLATGRPPWVLKGTLVVAAFLFIVPLVLLAVLLIAAGLVTALTWSALSAIAHLIDTITGRGNSDQPLRPNPRPADDGRENVRVVDPNR